MYQCLQLQGALITVILELRTKDNMQFKLSISLKCINEIH